MQVVKRSPEVSVGVQPIVGLRKRVEDARQLVTTALRTSGAPSLPGFGLEQAKNDHYPGFVFFEVTFRC